MRNATFSAQNNQLIDEQFYSSFAMIFFYCRKAVDITRVGKSRDRLRNIGKEKLLK